jgi:hypothetical protein
MSVLTPKSPENIVRRLILDEIGVFNKIHPIIPENVKRNVDQTME